MSAGMLTSAPRAPLEASSEILVITINHANAGFFAYVMFVLNQLAFAEERGMIPVVNFGPQSGDGPNAFHDPNHGDNMWDYYFEPVAGYTYAEILGYIADPEHPLQESNLHHLSDHEQSWLHAGRPESIYNYQYGRYTNFSGDVDTWFEHQRQRAHGLITRSVSVKPSVATEVDRFAAEYFSKHPVIGLHLRGTDKGCASDAHAIMSIVPPPRYFVHVDAFLKRNPHGRIFVATDQQQYLEKIRRKYGSRVLARSAIRSLSHRNPFQISDGENYRKGFEVLVDCLLLSRCDRLIKCTSAVGEFALYFNPSLPSLDLNQTEDSTPWFPSIRRWLGSDAAAFSQAWRQLARKSETTALDLLKFTLAWNPLMQASYRWIESHRFSSFAGMRWLALLKDYTILRARGAERSGEQIRERADHASRRVGSGYYTFADAPRFKYLEIRNDADPSAAFFAQFAMVLQQIWFAEVHRLTPVVNLDQRYNPYRDSQFNPNVWENYFRPVAGVSAAELEDIDPREITFLEAKRQSTLFLGEGDQPPCGYSQRTQLWWRRQREMGARLTAKYVRVDPQILAAVRSFQQTEFGDCPVLGVHLRGTDKSTRFDGRPFDAPLPFLRIIPPEEYWPVVDHFLRKQPDGLVFVATDQCQFLDAFSDRYGDRIRFSDSLRSSNATAVFRMGSVGHQQGVEVLVDCLILSQCDLLVKCMSNVGEVACYFNPRLPVVDMMYPEAVRDYLQT